MKKYLAYLLCATQISTAIASNDEHGLYKANPTQYYSQHPAITDEQHRGNIEWLPSNVILDIGSFLDFKTAQNFVRALWCTNCLGSEHHLAKNLGVIQIPNRYTEVGLYYGSVFIEFEHPAWTPSKMPVDDQLAFHGWFFKARALMEKNNQARLTDGNLSLEVKAELTQAFRMFYSAGCLGHMLAAKHAGQLLLDSRLNDSIPVIPTYNWLMPGTAQLDVKRLNQPMSKNPAVETLVRKLEEAFIEFDDSADSEDEMDEQEMISKAIAAIPVFKAILPEAQKLAETSEEATIIVMLLEHIITTLESGQMPEDDMPDEIKEYAKSVTITSPLIASFLNGDQEYTEQGYQTALKNVELSLNYQFLDDLAESLTPQVATIIHLGDGHEKHDPIFSREAKLARIEQQRLQRLAILLGSKDTYITSPSHSIDPQNLIEHQVFQQTSGPQERAINLFLYHLILTRGISANEYRNIQNTIKYLLEKPWMNSADNPNRLLSLNKDFGYVEDRQND